MLHIITEIIINVKARLPQRQLNTSTTIAVAGTA